MTISRSTFYKAPNEETRRIREKQRDFLRAEIEDVLVEWPSYGYRRVTRELRRNGVVVNYKRVARIMREEALTPRRIRRYITTTDSGMDILSTRTSLATSFRRVRTSCGWRT